MVNYDKYKNENSFTKWKINSIDFFLESRYEPIDISTL